MNRILTYLLSGGFCILSYPISGQAYVTCLNDARQFYEQGYYAKASTMYESCLPEVKASKGLYDSVFLNSYESSGKSFQFSGQYEKALFVYHELSLIHSSIGKTDSVKYASDIDNIAECYYSLGKYDTALILFKHSQSLRLSLLGASHIDYAETIDNMGILYCDIGNYSESFSLLQEAKRIRQEAKGTENVEYAKSLDNIGTYYYTTGDYKLAFPFFEQAVEIKSKVLGAMHPEYAKSVNNLASLNYVLGDYDKALILYLEASAINKEKLGSKHLDYGIDLNNLAMLYKKLGNYSAALPLLKEFSSICEATIGKNHPYYATSLLNLGGVYSIIGNYDTALFYYLEAKEIIQDQLGNNHADYARVLNSLALVYKKMCDYEKSLSFYKEALAICSVSQDKKRDEYARVLNNLATLYIKLGNYKEALLLYEESSEINKRLLGENHQEYAASLNNLGLLYSDMGNYRAAIELQERAALIDKQQLGATHPYYATDLLNLANQYSAIKKYPEALAKVQEASAAFKQKFGEKNQQYALSLSSMGRILRSMGEYEAALQMFKQASEIYKEVSGVKNADYAMSLRNMAINYKEMGELATALPLLEEASSIYFELFGPDHPDYIHCKYKIAGIYIALGDIKTGIPLMEQVNVSFRQRIIDYFSFLPEGEKKIYLANIAYFNDDFLSCMMKGYSDYPELCGYGYDNELFMKGVILSSVAAMQQTIFESGDTVLISKYEQMRLLKRQVNAWQQKPIPERHVDLAELEARIQKMEKEITRQSKTFSEMQTFFAIRWRDVQKNLKENEAAIEFLSFRFYKDEKETDSTLYGALVLRYNDTIPQMIFLCEESKLKNALPSLGNSYKDINQFYRGRKIYDIIWKPLNNVLEGINTVYYAPSGLLNKISFAAITAPDSMELLKKFRLIQFTSTRKLAFQMDSVRLSTAVVYGGIDYDTDTSTLIPKAGNFIKQDEFSKSTVSYGTTETRAGFRYLPGTLKEAEMVTNKLKVKGIDTRFISGSGATEESFIALSGQNAPSIIHLSTHGFYFPDIERSESTGKMLPSVTAESRFRNSADPLLRSGLLMAGANQAWQGLCTTEDEDGILTAKEVSIMNLINTQLVVLSACQTGQGDVKGNEGVEGLQRGFKIAGARFLLMSLWEVPDRETTEFMNSFYQNLLSFNNIHDAFRETQLYMSNQYKNEPFKWASFVLVE